METKILFLPGDRVTLRQDIPNKPIMYVVRKVTKTITFGNTKDNTQTKNDYFQGIFCRWFTDSGLIQEAAFNTKDLIKL